MPDVTDGYKNHLVKIKLAKRAFNLILGVIIVCLLFNHYRITLVYTTSKSKNACFEKITVSKRNMLIMFTQTILNSEHSSNVMCIMLCAKVGQALPGQAFMQLAWVWREKLDYKTECQLTGV